MKQEELIDAEFRKQSPELAREREKVAAVEKKRAAVDATVLSTLVSISVPRISFRKPARPVKLPSLMGSSASRRSAGLGESYVTEPTDAQLTSFMQENAQRLTRPEFRVLTVVRFSPAAVQELNAVIEIKIGL